MDDKLKQIQKLLDAAEGNLHSARNLMRELVGTGGTSVINPEEKAKELNVIEEGRIIEGVYNGENMVGPDGKEYPVPANYASKSKLVEGDVLKLTIAEDGSFIFKQIKPIERRKAVGTLIYSGGNYAVNAEGKTYKVLQASVTYYKGDPGDQVSIIIPKDHESTWAAIENIIKSGDEEVSVENSTENSATSEEAETNEPIIETPEETNTESTDSPQEIIQENTTNTTDTQQITGNTEETDQANDGGPEIEFPTNQVNESDLTSDDQAILESLANKTVSIEPEKDIPQETSQKQSNTDENSDAGQGIKELEI